MKKFIALSLSALLLLSLTACSSSEEETTTSEDASTSQATTSETEDTSTSPYDVSEAVSKINEVNVMDPSRDISVDTLTLRGIDSSLYKAFAGTEYPVTPGIGTTLVIEANEGKVAEVEALVTEWKDYQYSSNENYPGNITDSIENSRIVTKGNYVIFVVAMNDGSEDAVDFDEIYSNIDVAIDEFFK